MLPKQGQETSHEMHTERRMQIIYARKMQERRIFMEDLKDYRKMKDKLLWNAIKDSVGPKWYQALSVPQRLALDTLEISIYQDLLEGRPIRILGILKKLGIYPRPCVSDLMQCAYLGRDDPKETLAQLFILHYGHHMEAKRTSYDLNSRLLLSGIFYLGLDNLVHLLRERFRPDQLEAPKKPKPKPKIEPPLESPYLQTMVACLYEPEKPKRKGPPPLPNLDSLNEPLEETPPHALLKIPPPPPPPKPKKRLPRSYCDKIAGIIPIEPHTSVTGFNCEVKSNYHVGKKLRRSRFNTEGKKVYGIGSTRAGNKSHRRRKLKAPTTGQWNSQYTICGVYIVRGKSVFVVGSISVLPTNGDLINGGFRLLNGEYINIHCGYRAIPPPPPPDPCDCVKRWTESVFKYVRKTKCYCGHHYDYGNEGRFSPEELPFFNKPTRHAPFQFNYETIYDLNPKSLLVSKEFKSLWEKDSMLRVDDDTQKKKPQKKKKRSSTTCLGENPKPEDYLRCALHQMRRVNIAARLPDIHLAPELVEWMRRRLYGPLTPAQAGKTRNQSKTFWQMFSKFARRGIPHVRVPRLEEFRGHTDWIHKQSLNDKFRKFTDAYKLNMFRSQAEYTNYMWPSMCQAQFPDKKFREIYFSYLVATAEDIHLMHPYSSYEAADRHTTLKNRRYCCPPAGIEPPE